QLGEMTRALLQLSALGKRGISRKKVDMTKLVDSGWKLVQDGTIKDVQIRKEGMDMVNVDPDLMVVVWRNLLENAVKYRKPEGELIIKVSSEPESGGRWRTISDNGIGIDTNWGETIFHPFQRMGDESKQTGVGVGLAT